MTLEFPRHLYRVSDRSHIRNLEIISGRQQTVIRMSAARLAIVVAGEARTKISGHNFKAAPISKEFAYDIIAKT